MKHLHALLATLLVVGLNLKATAGDSTATWKDFQARPVIWANRKFHQPNPVRSPGIFEVTSSVGDSTPSTDPSNSTSGGDWIAQCHKLSDNLEQSWNLTVVVLENNWPVVENVAQTLYHTITTCTAGSSFHIIDHAKCLIDDLEVLKGILEPAVKMNFSYVQEALKLIPQFVTAMKECFTF